MLKEVGKTSVIKRKKITFFGLVFIAVQESVVYCPEYPLSISDVPVCYPSDCCLWSFTNRYLRLCGSRIHFFLLRYFCI